MNAPVSSIYKEEVCLNQESGMTHERSSPEDGHANEIGLDDGLDDGDKELSDEDDDDWVKEQVEASDIIDDDTNPSLCVEATLPKDEPVILVQPRYSKVNSEEDCAESVPDNLDSSVYNNNTSQDIIKVKYGSAGKLKQACQLKNKQVKRTAAPGIELEALAPHNKRK